MPKSRNSYGHGYLVYYEGLPGLGGLEEVIVSLNSGEARIIGGWGGIYIYMLYALWNEAREEGVSFFQDADLITKLLHVKNINDM